MDSRFEALQRSLSAAVEGMSSDQLNWHPAGKWSAAEVLEHLYLTYAGTLKGLKKVLARDTPLATRASLTHRLLTFLVVRLQYMPPGRKAPRIVLPSGLPPEQVRSELGLALVAMDEIITRCEARFGRHVKLLDHPILGPLNATEWRMLHVVHGRHHHKQLRRLRTRAEHKRSSRLMSIR